MIDKNTRCIEGPGPASKEECSFLIAKIASARHWFSANHGHYPNTIILSRRQWEVLMVFAYPIDIEPMPNFKANFRGMKIVVDARGDYPNTPLVGHIEF